MTSGDSPAISVLENGSPRPARAGSLKVGKKDVTLVIEAAREVPWEDVIQVMDLGKKEGLKVELVASRGDTSGAGSTPGARVVRLDGKSGIAVIDHDGLSLVNPASDKIKWKTAIKEGSKGAKVRVDAKSNVLVVDAPGRTVILDLDTGKVVKESTRGPEGKPDRAILPQEASMAAHGLGFNASSAPAGSPVDVLQLGSALIEAQGAARLAESALKAMSGTEGVVSQRELMAGEIQLDTARRKIDFLRRIAESAYKGTKVEIDTLREVEELARRRHKAGQASEDAFLAVTVRRAQAETHARLLEELLKD